jgi:hypothetical protein
MKQKPFVAAMAILAVLTCVPVLAGVHLAQGTFRGSGAWEAADGSTGRYTTETTVSGATLSSRWTYVDGGKTHEESHAMTLAPAPDGTLRVLDETNRIIGSARCLGDECLLTVEEGPVKLVETVCTRNGQLLTFGAKSGPGFAVVYSETLAAW